MNLFYITLIALIVCVHSRRRHEHKENVQLNLLQWKEMQFWYPNSNDTIQRIPNAIPADVQPYFDSEKRLRVFLTLPKFKSGVPYTLAEVSQANDPYLKPYPNYEMHDNKNGSYCDGITSAFRMAIDECDQLWVIDSGVAESNFQCPPQLLVFNLQTDKLVHRYRFHESLYVAGKSLFITPIVNVKNRGEKCLNTMVYVADVNHHGLVVYDYKKDEAWRIDNEYMYPEPKYINQTVANEPVSLSDGIFGLATDKKNLYFNPLASLTEYAVPLSVIDDKNLFLNNSGNKLEEFIPLGERKSACLSSAMDSRNNLYCVTLDPIELLVWNVHKPYNSRYIKSLPIVAEDLQFVSGIKVKRNPYTGKEELWMLSNRYQRTFPGIHNPNETNVRVVIRQLDDVPSRKRMWSRRHRKMRW